MITLLCAADTTILQIWKGANFQTPVGDRTVAGFVGQKLSWVVPSGYEPWFEAMAKALETKKPAMVTVKTTYRGFSLFRKITVFPVTGKDQTFSVAEGIMGGVKTDRRRGVKRTIKP